jgi:hypothetical protein
MDPLILILI